MRSAKRTKAGDCPAGQQWWVCHANNFVGCCSVDACDLPSCPDYPSTSLTSLIPASTLTLTVPSTPSNTFSPTTSTQSLPTSTLSSTSTTSTSTPSISTSQISSTLLGSAGAASSSTTSASSTTGSATSSLTATVSTSSSNSKSSTPIIAGVVFGVIFLIIMALTFWFCIRRRKQANEKSPKIISQYGVPDNDFVLSRPTISEPRLQENIFAPFGGVYHSRNFCRSEEHQQIPAILPTSSPPHVIPAHKPQSRSPSHAQTASQGTLTSVVSSSHAQAQAEAISACAPKIPPKTPPRDPEKAALAPPPEHEHPIYGIPSFTAHPGTLVNPNLEPIRGIDSSLQNLPAFMHNPTKSYEREQKYRSLLRRTSEVTRSTTTSRRHQGWGNSPYTDSEGMGPSPATTFDSPVPGVSELDGENILSPMMRDYEQPIVPGHIELEAGTVPERYLSHASPRKNVKEIRDSVIIPVGLGVGVDPSTPTSMYPHTPDNETFPSTDAPQVPSLKSRFNQPNVPEESELEAPSLFAATREVLDGRQKEVVSPISPDMQRWSGVTAIGSRGGTPADMIDIVKRRRESWVPLSGISVDVEREWGSWALR